MAGLKSLLNHARTNIQPDTALLPGAHVRELEQLFAIRLFFINGKPANLALGDAGEFMIGLLGALGAKVIRRRWACPHQTKDLSGHGDFLRTGRRTGFGQRLSIAHGGRDYIFAGETATLPCTSILRRGHGLCPSCSTNHPTSFLTRSAKQRCDADQVSIRAPALRPGRHGFPAGFAAATSFQSAPRPCDRGDAAPCRNCPAARVSIRAPALRPGRPP